MQKQLLVIIIVITVLALFFGCTTTHPTCGNNLCEQFPNGENELDSNSTYYCPTDCGNPLPQVTHAECSYQRCVQVQGVGSNQCTINDDCIATVYHSECSNQQCIQVAGAGIDQCSSNADCQNPQFHSECASHECIMVAGAGVSECSKQSDCIQAVCGNGTCEADENATTCPADCNRIQCAEDSDYGFNTVLRGQPFMVNYNQDTGDYSRKPVGSPDTCMDANMLLERSCDYNWMDSNSYVNTTPVTCPYGCANGACILGPSAQVCLGAGNCLNVDENSNCYSRSSWRGEEYINPFTTQGMDFSSPDFGVNAHFDSNCVDENTVDYYYCKSFTPNDRFLIPAVKEVKCDAGYICGGGKCTEAPHTVTSLTGDLTGDGQVNAADVSAAQTLVSAATYSYDPRADVDFDGFLDTYDVYRLGKKVSDGIALDAHYPVRNFTLTSTNPLYTTSDNMLGTMSETSPASPFYAYTWSVEHKQLGNSRAQCAPPVLKINLKDVTKNTRILGAATPPATSNLLRYDEFKMVSDCDVWGDIEADNLVRESFIYWLFRKYGVPDLDVIAFANVKFNSPDTRLDPNKTYHYFFLQRLKSSHDQVPLPAQFGFSQTYEKDDITQAGGQYISDTSDRFTRVDINWGTTTQTFSLDANTAIRYFIFTSFTNLSDRSIFWNEYYGNSSALGKWQQIPYDFDSSFYCTSYEPTVDWEINSLPTAQQAAYKAKYYAIAREIFDNPNNLYAMLMQIDQFPFAANKSKMKGFIRAQFYNYALYFGSQEFAQNTGQTYVPFTNQVLYVREARHIMDAGLNYDTLCKNDGPQKALEEALAKYAQP